MSIGKPIRRAAIMAAVALAACAALAQSPAEIIARHLEALGGRDAYKAVETIRRVGTIQSPQQGTEAKLTIYAKRPNLLRHEIEVQGTLIVQAHDGERVWAVNPFSGSSEPQFLPEEAGVNLKRQAQFDDLFFDNPKKLGVTLRYQGEDEQDGRKLHCLSVVYSNGHEQRRYYDAETGLLYSVSQRQPDPAGGEVEVRTTLHDWRVVGGLKFVHRIETSSGQTILFTDIAVNESIKSDLFAAQ